MPAEKRHVTFMLALLLATNATGLATVQYGNVAPDFTFAMSGVQHNLRALRGKPVVINFWASWCPPCTDELPFFVRLQTTYGDRVRLLTISNESFGVARRYLAAKRLHLPLVEDTAGTIFAAYSIRPVPDTVVLDADGSVTYVSVGGLDWSELKSAVDHALSSSSRLGMVRP